MKFDHRNGSGQRVADSVCWLVISAVERMNTNGTRNTIDRAMATEWLATDSSRRRRRIAGGTGRRAAAAPAAVGGGDRGYWNPPW